MGCFTSLLFLYCVRLITWLHPIKQKIELIPYWWSLGSIFYSVAVSLTRSVRSFSKWCGRRFVGGGYAKSWITEISEMPDICLSDLQYLPSLATKSRHRLNGMRWLGLADEWTALLQPQEVGPVCELSWPMSSFALISLCTDSFFSPSC